MQARPTAVVRRMVRHYRDSEGRVKIAGINTELWSPQLEWREVRLGLHRDYSVSQIQLRVYPHRQKVLSRLGAA